MAIAQLSYVDQEIWCRTPYHEGFIAALKDTIRFPYRRWEPVKKVWVIDSLFEAELIDLCETYFDGVRQHRPEAARRQEATPSEFGALFVTSDAPMPVIEAASRALCKLWHPDISDDPAANERMTAINLAYQRIKQVRS